MIKREGTVTDIENGILTVRICRMAACDGCSAKMLCGTHRRKAKLIECHVEDPERYKVGDRVKVCISNMTSLSVVILSFIVPLIVFFVVLLPLASLGKYDDWELALASIGAVVAYYGALFIFHDTIKHRIIFSIED